MRFYVPGKSIKPKGSDAGSDADDDVEMDEDGNEISAAEALHNLIKDKADIGALAGDSIVVFEDVLVLTPRCVSAPITIRHTHRQRSFLSGILPRFPQAPRQVDRLPCTFHLYPPHLPTTKSR